MTVKRRHASPLALAVLSLLYERPMHPYEMAATLKDRRKDKSIKVRYGSLYTVIDALQRDGLIVPRETRREGRRPERTVFSLTPSGADELKRWMSDLLGEPVKEYAQFEAALSLMPVLPPEAVASLLRDRAARLSERIDGLRAEVAEARRGGLASLFLVEDEYELTMAVAERRFVRRLIDRMASGELGGMEFWRSFHSARSAGAERAKPRQSTRSAAPPSTEHASEGRAPAGAGRPSAASRGTAPKKR